MEQKIKLIAVVLVVLCLVASGFAYSFYDKFTSLTREFGALNDKKKALEVQVDDLEKKMKKAEEAFGRLRKDKEEAEKELNRTLADRDDLKKSYTKLSQERNELVEKLQEAMSKQSAQEPVAVAAVPIAESGTDEYWAGVLKQKADLDLQLSNIKNTLKDNQIRIDELTRDKANFDMEMEKLTKEKTDIERQLEYNTKMVDSLTLQLVREKDDKRKIEKHASLLKEENYALRSRLKEVMTNKVGLEKRLKDTDDKRTELYGRLSKIDSLLQDRLSDVIDVKQDLQDIRKGSSPASASAVELSPIVVRSPLAQQQAVGMKEPQSESAGVATSLQPGAKVISINEENNFVILNTGENQGIYKGQRLTVYRGESPIATLEVIQLKPNVCAADIREKTADIKAGDTAK